MVWSLLTASEATAASKTALEIRSELRFDIRDPKYLHIHVHIAYMFWAHFVTSEATTASKQPRRSNLKSDLKFMTQTTYATMFILLF